MMVDGVIENWWIERGVVRGLIHGDAKGRFPDGRLIHTSLVQEGPDSDGVVLTLNSAYKLGKPVWMNDEGKEEALQGATEEVGDVWPKA